MKKTAVMGFGWKECHFGTQSYCHSEYPEKMPVDLQTWGVAGFEPRRWTRSNPVEPKPKKGRYDWTILAQTSCSNGPNLGSPYWNTHRYAGLWFWALRRFSELPVALGSLQVAPHRWTRQSNRAEGSSPCWEHVRARLQAEGWGIWSVGMWSILVDPRIGKNDTGSLISIVLLGCVIYITLLFV